MRIFEVIEASTNRSVPHNRTWYRNLYEPLVELGHDVFLFPAEEGRLALSKQDPRRRAAFSQRLLDAFRAEHARQPFDLIFTYLMDGMLDPGVIDLIRQGGVPACNFSCNNAHQFYLVDELAPHFDFNLHAERDAGDKFRAIGANPLWWPMASNPRYFKPQNLPRTIAASFVGANYALRSRYIAQLLASGIDVHAYGPGWVGSWKSPWKRYLLLLKSLSATSPERRYRSSASLAEHDQRLYLRARYASNLHPPIADEELIALYSRSQISLGFLEVYANHDPSQAIRQHLHLREFEAPMCGALHCTGYSDELAEMFTPDEELLAYRDQHELVDKIHYYLAHPEQAGRIRQAGHARALRDHTYQQRFVTLFRQIGLAEG